jgi:tRNA A37 threonylcarbamoyladenosine synthetase subunit TsaC/SUA5/YrdC
LTKRDEVGIRIPDNLVCLGLVSKLGNPILSSSVRLPDDQLLDDPREIDKVYKGRVELVIDGGTFLPEPSSIISLLDDEPVVIREGKGDVSFFQ